MERMLNDYKNLTPQKINNFTKEQFEDLANFYVEVYVKRNSAGTETEFIPILAKSIDKPIEIYRNTANTEAEKYDSSGKFAFGDQEEPLILLHFGGHFSAGIK